MERTTARSNPAARLFAILAIAALTWMALMAAASAHAASPEAPAGPQTWIMPPEYPYPDPGGGDNGSLCSPDQDCTPPDRCDERPDAPECVPDPCEERPEAEECNPGGGGGGGKIPTPTRVETGGGGTAGTDQPGIGALVVGAGALGLLTALTRRLVVARDQR